MRHLAVDRAAPTEITREGAVTARLKGNGAAGPAIGERAMNTRGPESLC